MPKIENQTNLENSLQPYNWKKIKQRIELFLLGSLTAFALAACAPEGNSAQDPSQVGADGSLPGETFQDNGVTPPDDAIDLYDYYEKYKMSPEEIAKLLEEVQKMDLKKIQTADFQGYYYKLNKDLVLKDIGALVDITDEKVSYKFSEIVKLVGIAFDGQGNYKFLEDGDTNGIILKYGNYLIFANKNTGQTKSDLLRFVRENLYPSGEMKELEVNSADVLSQSNTPEAAENILKIDGQTDSGK